MKNLLDHSEWYEALTLSERAALPHGPAPRADFDRDLAEKRARRWRHDARLLDDDVLRERLATDGLDPESFLYLLTESPEALRERCPQPPDWLRELSRTLAGPRSPSPAPMPFGEAAESEHAGFLELLGPLLDDAYTRLRQGIRKLLDHTPNAPFGVSVSELLTDKIPAQILWVLSRTLTLELHIGGLEEKLLGKTPEARFRNFLDSLSDRDTALEILRGYPLLPRVVALRLEQWRTASLAFLEHLAADRGEIAALFGSELGPVSALDTGLSDRHHGGRTVILVTFASGSRLIYKPRSLAVEERFQRLLEQLGARGAQPPFRVLKVLDRGDHGWVEHVAPAAVTSRQEVERFYERQGAYLALLYALEATDFHYENLIAAGEHPVLIDLETLMQPHLPVTAEGLGPDANFAACTVLRSGLLPRRSWIARTGVDMSGLGSSRGQVTERYSVEHAGTDQMRHVLVPMALDAVANTPSQKGEDIPLYEMTDVVDRGFRRMYRLLASHREELLAADGPLTALAEAETRVLLRPTEVYAQLLVAGYHPDLLRGALRRDRFYDKLWIDAVDYPPLRRFVRAELDDLARCDIPRFKTRPGSRDLITSTGQKIADAFPEAGLELVRRRFAGLDEDDLERQSWLVRTALDAGRPAEMRVRWSEETLPETVESVDPGRFRDMARQLGQRLETLAVHRGELVSWFHLAVDGEGMGSLEPVGLDLYNGLPGIALFLAHLGEETGERRYTELARATWETTLWQIERLPEALKTIGAWNGWGGLLHAATHLGLLWNEPGFLDRAAGWIPRLASAIEDDGTFDVIGGAAGAIHCLLELGRHRASTAALDAAVACGHHLLAGAIRGGGTLGWPSVEGGERPLTGCGHGAAGMAWAFSRLAAQTDDPRFRDAARAAMAYERGWFSAEDGSWPDLREESKAFFHAWCHGAPGIGLARLGSLPFLDEEAMHEEIRAAVEATLEHGFGGSHCLCHGDLGNLDLVVKAGGLPGGERLGATAEHLAGRILAGIEQRGWRCGGGAGRELPGLMTGLAGIGYGLLRAASPHRVPSVLLFETPSLK